MESSRPAHSIKIPKPGKWPGKMDSFRLVKPYVKYHFWDLFSVYAISLVSTIILRLLTSTIFSHRIVASLVTELLFFLLQTFFGTAIIAMYFAYLKNEDFTLKDAFKIASERFLSMAGLTVVTGVILLASFLALIIPFFIVFPRLYLAPYFLISHNLTVNEAIAASWETTRGNAMKVYGLWVIQVGLLLLCITVIGIPFAIYWYVINRGSFALLTLHLAQPAGHSRAAAKAS